MKSLPIPEIIPPPGKQFPIQIRRKNIFPLIFSEIVTLNGNFEKLLVFFRRPTISLYYMLSFRRGDHTLFLFYRLISEKGLTTEILEKCLAQLLMIINFRQTLVFLLPDINLHSRCALITISSQNLVIKTLTAVFL